MTPSQATPDDGSPVAPFPTASQGLPFGVSSAAKIAAQAWAAAMQQRQQPCKMAPWDEQTYAAAPVSRVIIVQNAVDTIVAPSNPNRIAIIFSTSNAAPVAVYLNPGSAINPANPTGMNLSATIPAVTITQKDFLNLASAEWHAVAFQPGVDVRVIEVILNNWPKG